ncbi:hypothetical protein F4824DRAFT_484475 [Ustulina deusta]|nr:hypothetical protein F4824DRAFT_484475 [Ustulina deusta]
MSTGCPSFELTEELSKFCGIEEPEYIALLSHILTQNNHRRIDNDLRRLLGRICSVSARVVACIGHEYDESARVMDVLNQIYLTSHGMGTKFWPPDVPPVPPSWPANKMPNFKDEIWNKLDLLVGREWFKRAWVVQELALLPARAIIKCGKSEIDWDHLIKALTIYEMELNRGRRKSWRKSQCLID